MEEDIQLPFAFFSGCSQEGERGVRWRDAFAGCGRAVVARCREPAWDRGTAFGVPEGQARPGRDPDLIRHTVEEMVRLRMFAIAAGCEDANDFDRLRYDSIFKMAAHLQDGGGTGAGERRSLVLAAGIAAA